MSSKLATNGIPINRLFWYPCRLQSH